MGAILQHILNFIVPPRCLMCNQIVSDTGWVCASCFKELDFIEIPYCHLCARPFVSEAEAGKDHICLECNSLTISWHNCRAAFVYNEGFKKLIMPLKYGDQQKSLNFLSYFMHRAAQDILNQIDLIIPVPLHKKRLRYRKYNQSALLASKIGKMSKVRILPMGLLRTRETMVLGHFNKQDRQILLKNAFTVCPDDKIKLINKRVLLIDDVMTTGSTLNECASTLLNIGVAQVDILVAAKVVL